MVSDFRQLCKSYPTAFTFVDRITLEKFSHRFTYVRALVVMPSYNASLFDLRKPGMNVLSNTLIVMGCIDEHKI
jgi:hypothetical protein